MRALDGEHVVRVYAADARDAGIVEMNQRWQEAVKEDDGLRDAHKAFASQIVQKQRAENLSDVSKQDKRQIVEQRFYR